MKQIFFKVFFLIWIYLFEADIFPEGRLGIEEPDWILAERKQFLEFRDKNKDKVLDREEVAAWILPSDYDYTLAEAKHLIHEADKNNVKIN